MEGIIDLHHEIMFYIILIIVFVLWMLLRIVLLFGREKITLPYQNTTNNNAVEWA